MYPECEKLKDAQDQSQTIGEFLEWLEYRGVVLCVHCNTNSQFFYNPDLTDEDGFEPVQKNREDILAQYFDIDLNKVEQERQQILSKLQEGVNEDI
ncbi:MAG: hypothetical protein ACW96U_00875 [Candidatus Heimdallarchaeaceae archaeon]|jgi:hypothetical protein